jgi:hypothetical protein
MLYENPHMTTPDCLRIFGGKTKDYCEKKNNNTDSKSNIILT